MSTPPLPPPRNPQVHMESPKEESEEEEELGAQEEGPLVFHHHYLPCPMPALGLQPPWPAPFLPAPPHQPPLQAAPRIQQRPPARKRGA